MKREAVVQLHEIGCLSINYNYGNIIYDKENILNQWRQECLIRDVWTMN